MRVTFATCDDFCAELDRVRSSGGTIFCDEVRVRIDSAPEQDDEITFLVAIWGTAIVHREQGDYLLEYGEVCGKDDNEQGAKHPTAGTDAATKRRDMISAACKRAGLQMLPGKFEAV